MTFANFKLRKQNLDNTKYSEHAAGRKYENVPNESATGSGGRNAGDGLA